MRPESLPYDEIAGIHRTLHWDDAERKLIIENHQECGDILAWNRALSNAERSSSSLWGGRSAVRVASIPNNLVEEWHRKGVSIYRPEGRARILAWLSSNDYADLRTAPGRLA